MIQPLLASTYCSLEDLIAMKPRADQSVSLVAMTTHLSFSFEIKVQSCMIVYYNQNHGKW